MASPSTRSVPPVAVAAVRAARRANPYVAARSAYRRSQVRRLDRSILPDGYERVLHHHVRKTAGTSLNAAFRDLGGPGASRATGEARLTGSTRPDIPSPDLPSSDLPPPDLHPPDRPAPDLQSPDLPSPDLQLSDRPSPDLQSPDLPSIDRSSPDLPSPDLPSPDLQSPDLRSGRSRHHVPGSSVRSEGLTFVTGAAARIDEGAYFFANSHSPVYVLHPPRKTFRLTILRNPTSRLVSHYRYLRHVRELDIPDGPSDEELGWAEGGFEDFVRRMPRRGRLRQLYMFSETFDVDQAARRIAGLDAVLFTETYADDLGALGERLGLPLEVRRERSFAYTTEVSDDEVRSVLPLLTDEMALVEQVARRLGRDPTPILAATPSP